MSHQNPSRKPASRLSTPVRLGVAAVAACFISAPVLSNPVNPVVVNGTASFNQAGNVLTVTNSNGAIINWDKFSIKAGETTHFAQTSASSSVMNRVLNDPSLIYGTLSSNGRVWLINPAGILVGPSGRIDTAGFVASTLNISNENFLAGRNLFVNDGNAQNVINQGEIRTPAGGSVYLIGSNVSNEGIITTPNGETILAAGAIVSLIDSALPGVKVDITGAEGNATNLGQITAEAGRIGIAGVIVRNSGTLNASSVVNEGGRIFLKASQDAYVDGNGRIVTTGTRGGSVEVLGNRVAVMDNAEIDASGTNGGGTILVGGDYQGKNPDIQNASISYFGPNATLKADATDNGDGGKVIVWADDTTRAYGSISARGGAAGGNGGFVETSGKRYLDAQGIRVNVGANNGTGGLWLLDPSDIDIVASGTTTVAYGLGVFSYGGAVGTVVADDISNALSSGNVTVHTYGGGSGSGNITANGVSISGSGALTLAAYGGGSATGNITIGNSSFFVNGGVNLLAGWNGGGFTSGDVIATRGDITISGSMIESSTGAVNLWAGKDIKLLASGTTRTWIEGVGMDVRAGNDLTLTGGGGSGYGGMFGYGPGVMLRSASAQTVTAGHQILLTAGSYNNFYGGGTFYGGSVAIEAAGNQSVTAPTIKLFAGTSGHDNSATIYGGGTQQDIYVTTRLELNGGGGGDENYAWIGASGPSTNQTIHGAGAAIVLNGGISGGSSNDSSNDASIGLGDGNMSGSQIVYAGSISINAGGGSSTYGGAGFGTENGRNQTFYVSGDLTMNGGGSSAADFLATPAYIGSQYGGGSITLNVGGNVILNGGSGTAGGVLIGSLDDSYGPTQVTILSANNITATGNTGGVWLGVKDWVANSTSHVNLLAGYDYGSGSASGYGGNIITSGLVRMQTDDSGEIGLYARESSAGARGNISLGAGTSVYGGSINSWAAGNNTLNGMLFANNSVEVIAGYDIDNYGASLQGGNVLFGSASMVMAGSQIKTVAYTGATNRGDIVQDAGSFIASYGSAAINFWADGDVRLNGLVGTDGTLQIYAGLNNDGGEGDPTLQNAHGGNIVLGANSEIYGGSIDLIAHRGTTDTTTGNITQSAGGYLMDGGEGSLNIYAAGNIDLMGTTVVSDYEAAHVYAGIDSAGNVAAYGDKHITIDSLTAYGGTVVLNATGPIVAYTHDAYNIHAIIDNSSSGGIFIDNTGENWGQPSIVSLTDNATANSSVAFTHTGSDLWLDSSNYQFSTYGGAGSILVAGNNIEYYGGPTFYGSSLILAAGGNLNINSGLAFDGNLGLMAGSTLNVNAGIEVSESAVPNTGNVSLIAPTINLTGSGYVYADNDAILIGSNINLAPGYRVEATNVFFGGGNLNLNGEVDAYGQLEFNLANVNGGYGGVLWAADSPSSNITGIVSGDIALTDGAFFQAGNDVNLTFKGSSSTVALSYGGYVLANSPDTITLGFTGRTSGGVIIDGVPGFNSQAGGSGFFVSDHNTPAGPGAGLDIKYAVTTNLCDINPALCRAPDVEVAVFDDESTRRVRKPDKDKDKCEPGSFGCDDQTNDGKKDEKSAPKKVAQCT